MGFTKDEIIIMFLALQDYREEINNELDDMSLTAKEHNEALYVSKVCNGLMRKIKKFADENNISLDD